MDENVGSPKLRHWLRNQFSIRDLPTEKKELINLLLFQLGFPVPEPPSGLNDFTNFIQESVQGLKRKLDRNMIRGMGASAFVELEKILKDITYFYCAYLIKTPDTRRVFGDWQTKQIHETIGSIYPGLKDPNKPFAKASLGELIGILGALNRESQSTTQIKSNFGRESIVPKKSGMMNLLNEINPYRKFFVHDVEGPTEPVSQETLQTVIGLMLRLASQLKEVYPLPIKAFRLVTSTFRTTYLTAKDERNREYTIYLDEYIGEDIFKHIYLIKNVPSYIAINPILVRRP